jgi:signal transduction histidine kinase
MAHKTLLANASHELRSPLSRLRMALERLPGNGHGTAQAEIARNIGELDILVEEILLASRLQAGSSEIFNEERVDLAGLLAEECAAYDAELNVPDGGEIIVNGDARLLRRLFRNLLDNASRYGGDASIEVTAGVAAGEAWAKVCDRGPGVPEDEREKIFEPFYRMTQASESKGGVGLGLALVRQIAEKHGAGVRCLARDGGGSCFEVRLPALIA